MDSIFSGIIDQQSAINQLRNIFFSSIKPTSLLFSGKSGIGKEAIAHAYSQSLNCEKGVFYPCGVCYCCQAVANSDPRFINFVFPSPKAENEDSIDEPYEKYADSSTNKFIQLALEKKKLIRILKF